MHAGSAIQRVHSQAGIIGQDQLSGRIAAVMLCLDAGILLKSVSIFYGQRNTFESRQRGHSDAQRAGRPFEITEFSGIGSGNVNSKCGCHASIIINNDLSKRDETMWRRVSLGLGFLILLLSGCVISPRRDGSSGGGGGGGTSIGKLYVTL